MVTAPAPQPPVLVTGGPDDLDSVLDIMTSAFLPDYGEAWSRSQCAGILPLSGVSLIVARNAHGTCDGFALQRVAGDESELLLLAVREPAQRLGVGTALLDRFIEEGRALGLQRLHLEVRAGNRAVEMYRRAGFCVVGRRRNYYRGPDGRQFDAITMVLELGK